MPQHLPWKQTCLLALFVGLAALDVRADCLLPHWTPGTAISRAVNHVRAVDLNADGRPDLVGNDASTIFVALNDQTGALGTPTDVYSGTIPGPVMAGDFNADGAVDLAFAGTASLIVLPGFGNGSFGLARTSQITFTPTSIAVANANQDAWPDLIVYDAILGVLVRFTNDGSAYFTEASRYTIGASARAFLVADFDADGFVDSAVSYGSEANLDALFGQAGNTFASPVPIRATPTAIALRGADMDGNGLMDVLFATEYGRVATVLNLGSRAFGDPLGYWDDGYLSDIEAADFTGDGALDAITVGARCGFRLWTGTGRGTLGYSTFNTKDPNSNCYYWYDAHGDADVADFDGDGRMDVVVASLQPTVAKSIDVYRNRCGDSTVAISGPALISAGKAADVTVEIGAPSGYPFFYGTGTVSILENGVPLATGTLNNSRVTIPVSDLSLGTHSLVAAYEGNEQYEAAQSDPLSVAVTAETTSVSLNIPAAAFYGRSPKITAAVTASNGQPVTAPLRIRIDGGVYGSGPGPTLTVENGPNTIGTHTVVADFLGDANQPASSATATYVVTKQTPEIVATKASAVSGQSTQLQIQIKYVGFRSSPQGTVTLANGAASYGSVTLQQYDSWSTFTIPALPAGRYMLRATYSGDANYGAVETMLPFNVFPATGEHIDARGTAAAVTVTWRTSKLIVKWRAASQTWAAAAGSCCPSQPLVSTLPPPETPYLYRMQGHDGTVTAADLAMRIAFADDPVIAGMPIKALHLQEIVRAANIVRAAANLSAISAAPFQLNAPIEAATLIALRSAINEARVALGAYPYPFAASIVAGAPVRAADVQELREAVR